MSKKITSLYFGLFHTLGDILVSTALIRTIKNKYPEASITYATSKEYIDVLENNKDISEIIACTHPYEVVLRSSEKPYDKVFLPLQLTGEHNTWHQRPPFCLPGEKHNLVDYYASKCEDDLVVEERKTYIYPQERHLGEVIQSIPELLRDRFLNTKSVTMHVKSRNPSKDWPLERFRELSHKIYNRYGKDIIINQIGGNDDPDIDTTCVNSLKGLPVLNTAAVVKRASLHIDIDSGPSFIADSLDIPTICIMGATTSNTSGPIGQATVFIEPSARECIGNELYTPCHSHCVIKPRECKFNISVDEVFSKVVEILDPIFKQDATE